MTVRIDDIDTPTLLVNETIAAANIRAFQAHAAQAGLTVRPHIKTHKTIHFAKAQMAAGAVGINCQKIGEAEVMADGGLDDILITFNILGTTKLERLVNLAARLKKLTVTADSAKVIEGLSQAFSQSGMTLNVLIECDTGGKRCGVQSPEEAVTLASTVTSSEGVNFCGLLTYPAAGAPEQAADFMTMAVSLLKQRDIDCPIVSTGGTPDMFQAATHGVFTEYRAGTYIYNDRSLIARGACKEQDCAAVVLATVVSRPVRDRAVIDAGSKVLTSDLLGLTGYGQVIGMPDVLIDTLSEEHGVLSISGSSTLKVGDRIRIIPNHVCVVSNMLDSVWLDSSTEGLRPLVIDARGCVS